jgi:hypothetical protein
MTTNNKKGTDTMSTKVQEYVMTLINHPDFMKVVAKRYGEIQVSGEHMIISLNMKEIAIAITQLEYHLTALQSETE